MCTENGNILILAVVLHFAKRNSGLPIKRSRQYIRPRLLGQSCFCCGNLSLWCVGIGDAAGGAEEADAVCRLPRGGASLAANHAQRREVCVPADERHSVL